MIKEKERREKARFKFAQYRENIPADEAKREQSTDYGAWDLWTPSDDEDDPWMQYMPNNPAFKAMVWAWDPPTPPTPHPSLRPSQPASRRQSDLFHLYIFF
jgi:hypothetical protein